MDVEEGPTPTILFLWYDPRSLYEGVGLHPDQQQERVQELGPCLLWTGPDRWQDCVGFGKLPAAAWRAVAERDPTAQPLPTAHTTHGLCQA